MPNVICLGELLIDFCAADKDASLEQARTFTKAPGGAPANVAVGVTRLGERAGFIGAVGNDPFGRFLRDVLSVECVDCSHLAGIDDVRTSLAFIASRSDGQKDITFYRNPGADMRLGPEHIDAAYIASAQALHYGSISLIDDSPSRATLAARRLAQQAGCLITYDPNWRPSLWKDSVHAREVIRSGFAGAHVAKVSQEEWAFITGFEQFDEGAQFLMALGVQLVVRSEGAAGATFATAGGAGILPASIAAVSAAEVSSSFAASGHVPGFAVQCVEPTGAGDGFMACLIVELLRHWRAGRAPGSLGAAELTRIIRRANAVGALATTKVGAIPSLPTAGEVEQFLRTHL
jgi:fructokinase